MNICIGKLRSKAVVMLLQEHHKDMLEHSPPASVHALDLKALGASNITFWSVWDGDELAGIGALKELDETHGEIKSMRTSKNYLRKGVAYKLLNHIIEQSYIRTYNKLSLETGRMNAFLPAINLYKKFGFHECGPFGTYQEDPYSMFMTRNLETIV